MWIADDVSVRREVDLGALAPVPMEIDYGILSLNRAYFELEVSRDDAVAVVEDESELLELIEAAGDDWDAIVELLDARYENPDDTSGLDAGMSGAVAALVVAGALPISSCNGGTMGDSHSSAVPHVLFACAADRVVPIEAAAASADCGLINNRGYLELFADDLRKMNRFARELLRMPPP